MWRDSLRKEGLAVLPECLTLSEMVRLLAREKAHILLCAANLVDEKAIPVLRAVISFFPRVKLMVVGDVPKALILSRIPRVTLTRSFASALKDCGKVAPPPPAPAPDPEAEGERTLRLLMKSHFLTHEEAAVLLAQSFDWTPGYAVLCVSSDSYREEVLRTLRRAASDLKAVRLLASDASEFYLILDKSPIKEHTLSVANEIRLRLFRETDAMFSIGIGRTRNKAGELHISRREADRACRATQIFGHNNVIHIDYLHAGDIEYAYPDHKERRLIEATMDGDAETAIRYLDDLFEVFRGRKDLNQGLLNKMILGVIVRLNISATARAQSFEKMNLDSLALSKLLSAKSADEAYAYLRKGIEDFTAEMEAITDVSRDALFYRLKGLREAGGPVTVAGLTQALDTTAGFIDAAVRRNGGGDMFSYFACEG